MAENNGGVREDTELIPAEPEDRVPAGKLMRPYVRDNNTVCTVDVSKPENRGLYMRIKNGEAKPLATMSGKTLDVVHWFVEPKRSKPDAQGECKLYPRIVLMCADGSLYSAGSNTLLAALADLLLFRPQCPWEPPERVQVEYRPIGQGKHVFNLFPVVDDNPPPAKKGGK